MRIKIGIEISKHCFLIKNIDTNYYYLYLWYGRDPWENKYRSIEIGFGYWSVELFRLK